MNTYQWKCPPPRPLIGAQAREVDAIISDIKSVSRRRPGYIWPTGLEIRAAMQLLEGTSSTPTDNTFWETKCRRLLIRPAIEPVAYSYWPRLNAMQLDKQSALNLASALAGFDLQFRDNVIGQSSERIIVFEPHEILASWLDDMNSARADPSLSHLLPCYYFCRVLMAHPFTDGNGRFARVMVHAAASQLCDITMPSIALAPALYREGTLLANILQTLSDNGDWSQFSEGFCYILRNAVHITEELIELEAGTTNFAFTNFGFEFSS